MSAAAETLGRLHQEAVACHVAGESQRAAFMFRSILALDPAHGPSLNSLCGNMVREGRREDALALITDALRQGAGHAMLHRIRADLLRQLLRYDEAVEEADLAVAADPADAQSLMFRSTIHYDRLALPAAHADATQAVAVAPDYPEAHLRLAELALLHGSFREGWAEYGWNERIRMAPPLIPLKFQQPGQRRWQGEPLGAGTLMLVADQGYGDAIQFSRYLPWVRDRGGRLAIACTLPLLPMIRQVAPEATLFSHWEHMPPFAAWTALSSLPGLVGTTLDTIPPVIPMAGAPAAVRDWETRLAGLCPPRRGRSGTRRVGLVWAGRPTHPNDLNRSATFAALAPLLALERIFFVSLQQGRAREEIGRGGNLAAAPLRDAPLLDAGPLLGDFGATAALIETLDLVITIDSAVAHLAGAMGKPVWLMVPYAPEWRWMLDRPDTPWYPGMRLFRAPAPRAWMQVAATMAEELR